MSQREKIPNQRNEYSTFTGISTTTPSLLKRVTNILSCLSNGIDSPTEIADYCNYSVSTVHRILQSLHDLDWVIQDQSSRRYCLGPLIFRLSSNPTISHRYLVLHALKEMYQLSELTQETINLGILNNLHFEKVIDIPSKHNLRIIEESDRYRGQFAGATAKVLLSQLSDTELTRTLPHIKCNNLADGSITDKAVFLEQIREIRSKGYSVSFGERIPGAVCISAPVKHYVCPAALYIVGPETRLQPALEACIKALKASVQRISDDIGAAFEEQGGPGT